MSVQAIITGLNGTVAPVVANYFASQHVAITPWDRRYVATEDLVEMSAFLDQIRPDWFLHIATGPPAWAEAVAQLCAQRHIRFLFTSSVSVFAAPPHGPYSPQQPPNADDDYGRYKRECEQRVRQANPHAIIARLGWQIGLTPHGNHMVAHLHKTQQEQGHIAASQKWYPSCAFLVDTAANLYDLMTTAPTNSLHHLEGNPGLTYFDIVTQLNQLLGSPWTVTPTNDPQLDNRLTDDNQIIRPLTQHFSPKNSPS
ncbi:MAG TPA: sugar nucleotide-binding protein [Anaerolineae bacterium]|nr:sugar nucleotide-binding protein [Anaerolineae bacterium]